MKIILLQDVAKIGRRFSIIDVPDGFARNKLIPTKAAVAATPENLKRYTAITTHAEDSRKQNEQLLAEHLKILEDTVITITASTNERGHLYEAITKEAIAAATVAANASIDATLITITKPIKDTGKHQVLVKSGTVKGEIIVEVLAE